MELIYDNPNETLVELLMVPHLDSASVLQQLLEFMSAGFKQRVECLVRHQAGDRHAAQERRASSFHYLHSSVF